MDDPVFKNPEAAGWQPEPQVLDIHEVHAAIP